MARQKIEEIIEKKVSVLIYLSSADYFRPRWRRFPLEYEKSAAIATRSWKERNWKKNQEAKKNKNLLSRLQNVSYAGPMMNLRSGVKRAGDIHRGDFFIESSCLSPSFL